MQLSTTFRHMDGSQAVREYTAERLDKIKKYFQKGPISAHAVFSVERGFHHVADLSITLPNGIAINAKETTEDMYSSIDLATAQLLERIIDAFEADPAARVAVLTGTGGTFCAGMDLQSAATGQFALTEKRGPLGIAGPPISKPVIAAVEGHALAGGCELALVADLIVASNESEFGIPEAKRGLVAAAGGALRLSQRLPRNIAMELALIGKPMSAVRLAELGLVNRLADPGKVLDAALELAAEITANAPLSLQASKQIIDGARDWSTTEEFQNQTDIAAAALLSEDAREGVAAFAEHREPVWTGR